MLHAKLLEYRDQQQLGNTCHFVLSHRQSWRDTHVARPIYEQLQTIVPEEYYLVANTAFS